MMVKRTRGITLIETLISIFVMSLVAIVVGSIYLNVGRFSGTELDRVDVDLSASRLMAVVDEELSQGKEILLSYSTGPTTYTTDNSTLVFSLPSLVSGQPSPSLTDAAVLFVENGELKLLIDADPSSSRTDATRIITRNVEDFFLRYMTEQPTASTGVTVTMRAQRAILGQSYGQTIILHETLRNHI